MIAILQRLFFNPRKIFRDMLHIVAVVGFAITVVGCDGALNAAPDFEMNTFSNANFEAGQVVSLATFESKPVVLNFWYPSCPPCRLEMPHFEAAFNAYKDQGVNFVGIQQVGLDTPEDGQKFIDEFGLTYALGVDYSTGVMKDYGVVSFPTTVFLNERHEIVRQWVGLLDESKLHELVKELLIGH